MSERDPFDVELDMLREFFDCWEALHAIRKHPVHRRQQEAAAQRLVDCAHTIRAFRQPVKLELVK